MTVYSQPIGRVIQIKSLKAETTLQFGVAARPIDGIISSDASDFRLWGAPSNRAA